MISMEAAKLNNHVAREANRTATRLAHVPVVGLVDAYARNPENAYAIGGDGMAYYRFAYPMPLTFLSYASHRHEVPDKL